MKFSRVEVKELLISWIVISFCFTYPALSIFTPIFLVRLLISLFTAGLGFMLHELAHKYVAQRMGCLAYYRMWSWGLALALITSILSGGGFIFAAPGAVYISYPIHPFYIDYEKLRRGEGLISYSGPLANIALAIVFYVVYKLSSGLIALIGLQGFRINSWLAIFNLIPIPPLDGWKVARYNVALWISSIALLIALNIL